MGYEQKITFDVENPNDIDHLLRSHRYFKRYDPERKLYSFSKSESWQEHEWPDADVAIESDGIYFCIASP